MKTVNFHTTTRIAGLWPALAVVLLLAQCLLLYGNTGRDDAFFTYWPSYTLAQHGSILNYNGERVEQSSTLLHTILLAAAQKTLPFIAIPTLSWLLSMLAGALTLLAFAHTLKIRNINTAATLILASSSSVVFWASSGMETLTSTLLFAAILSLCLQQKITNRQRWLLAIISAMAVLNRPEAFIVLLCFALLAWPLQCLLQWSLRKTDHMAWFTLLLATAMAAAAVSLWRHTYFNEWFPQPVTAKNTGNLIANILNGINYLVSGGSSITTTALTVGGLASAVPALFYWKHKYRIPVITCSVLALAQMAFIIATGGDWMEASRFLLPVIPALLLGTTFFLAAWPRLLVVAVIGMTMVALYHSWQFARTQSTGFAIHEHTTAIENYIPASLAGSKKYSVAEWQTKDALRDIPQLEHLESLINALEKYPQTLNIASIQMGFIPYHLSMNFPARLHFLDLRALSTRDLTDCAVLKTFPRTNKGLDISYDQFFALLPVLERQCSIRKPDIVYDLGYDMRKQVLQDNGYVITYREPRSIRGNFSTRAIGSELFVAIRRELATSYRLKDSDGNIPEQIPQPQNTPPNIVLAIADDISYDNFGFMGNQAARTPTLDQLAQQGTVFTTGYVPSAFCRPSLATLLTGQWPHQNHIQVNNGANPLPPGYVTLATRLQQHGYVTFSGGKFWEQEPQTRGFDSADTNWNRFARQNQDALWQFLDQNAGKQPFFIWWAPMLPHPPFNPPQKFLDAIDANAISVQPDMPPEQHAAFREREKVLLAMNLWFDSELGKLRDKLQANGQLDNTLFVFMADNGFSNRTYSKNSPYELGLRTPFVFSWPGHVPVQRIDAQTSSIHLYNTLLDFAGIPAYAGTEQSHSLKPVIKQQSLPVPEKLIGADYQSYTMRTDTDWNSRAERDIYALHIRDGDWKYVFYLRDLREKDNIVLTIKSGMSAFPVHDAGDEQLFYLPTDPYEENNLAAQPQQQQRTENYRRDALHWWYSTGGKPFDAIRGCPAQPAALCRKLAGMPAD